MRHQSHQSRDLVSEITKPVAVFIAAVIDGMDKKAELVSSFTEPGQAPIEPSLRQGCYQRRMTLFRRRLVPLIGILKTRKRKNVFRVREAYCNALRFSYLSSTPQCWHPDPRCILTPSIIG